MKITKYFLNTKSENFCEHNDSRNFLCSDEKDLRVKLRDSIMSWSMRTDNKRVSSFLNNINIRDLNFNSNKIEKEFSYYSKKFKISVHKKEYNLDYDKSNFIGVYHTGLRKGCESSSAWGLWNWINLCCDDKEYGSLVNAFWDNLYLSFLEVENYAKVNKLNYKKEKDSKRLSSFLFSSFFENIENFYTSKNNEFKESSKVRSMYYIMKGLLEGMKSVNEDSFDKMLFDVFYHKAL